MTNTNETPPVITAAALRAMTADEAMRVALDAWNRCYDAGDGFACSVGPGSECVLARRNNSEVSVYVCHGSPTVAPGIYAISPGGWACRIDVEIPGRSGR